MLERKTRTRAGSLLFSQSPDNSAEYPKMAVVAQPGSSFLLVSGLPASTKSPSFVVVNLLMILHVLGFKREASTRAWYTRNAVKKEKSPGYADAPSAMLPRLRAGARPTLYDAAAPRDPCGERVYSASARRASTGFSCAPLSLALLLSLLWSPCWQCCWLRKRRPAPPSR